ncbi:phage head-tail connector protein [Uliginosibacterium gangwonense]|uniref:phage head-tail connector protein n=1 Tax=Uliginosibacterium gangwonense TaxID=392736 RepID=UPI000375BA9C|nr:phage head-tail connector protein [Uliginosibacterium gangwonense]
MTALITLDAVKAYLGLGAVPNASQDALLVALIERASAAIENYCQRKLTLEARTEWRNGNNSNCMILRDAPIQSVEAVSIDGQSTPVEAISLVGRTIRLTNLVFRSGISNVRVDYTAGFEAIPADMQQACIETVALMFRRRDHLDVSSKALAGETINYIVDELTPSARRILSNYRIVAAF